MNEWQEYLKENYFTISQPGAYSKPHKLYLILKTKGFQVGYHKLREWLQNQYAYSLNQPVKYKFKRRRVITQGIDDIWDIYLADVRNLSQHNNNINYLLIVIDIFF